MRWPSNWRVQCRPSRCSCQLRAAAATIQVWLGHESPATTQKYLEPSKETEKQFPEITGKHATQFAARNAKLAASTINCGLRTLRRALNLAFEWGKLDKSVRIPLAKGERQRDRVLSDGEIKLYLDNCRQPGKDAAITTCWSILTNTK